MADHNRHVTPSQIGASLFFDHRDPEMVSRIGKVRGNGSSSAGGGRWFLEIRRHKQREVGPCRWR